MSITLREKVFGLTGTGKKALVGYTNIIESDLYAVGGTIFYIDENSTEVVEFFDQYGMRLESVAVGDKPYAYRIKSAGNGVDKYYVYHDEVFTSKRWTYYDAETIVEGDSRYDSRWPGYAFESLGTSRDIGAGKTNTQIVMEKDDGVYVQADSNGVPTVWYKIKEMRDNQIGGCNDWFLPSDKELEELRKAIGYQVLTTDDDPVVLSAGAVTGGTIAGTADGQTHYRDYNATRTCYPSATTFLSQYKWSSSETSAVDSWAWHANGQYWNPFSKFSTYSMVGVRAF